MGQGYEAMRQRPCPVRGCQHNISVTSKNKVCARCEQVIAVIEFLVKREQEAQKPRPSGLILPEGIRRGK